MADDDDELYFDKSKDLPSEKFPGLWAEDLIRLGILTLSTEQYQNFKKDGCFCGKLNNITMKQAKEMGFLKSES